MPTRLIFSTHQKTGELLSQLHRRRRCQRCHPKSELEVSLIKQLEDFRSQKKLLTLNQKINQRSFLTNNN